MRDPREVIAGHNDFSAILEVRSGLPLRDHRKVSVGYMRYSWPSRGYWEHIILGRKQAWSWFRTINGPAEFKGALSLAIRRWHRDD